MVSLVGKTRWVVLGLLVAIASGVVKPTLDEITPLVGPAMCGFLTMNRYSNWKLHKKCGQPTCDWDSWIDATHNTTTHHENGWGHRVVLSYGHNGFGNQLWQHTFAFMVAESLQARLLIAPITLDLSPNHYYPPNTWPGVHAMEELLPDEFELGKQSENDADRMLCEAESFYVSDRPYDAKRNATYGANFRNTFRDLIIDPNPRCLKFAGYFQVRGSSAKMCRVCVALLHHSLSAPPLLTPPPPPYPRPLPGL